MANHPYSMDFISNKNTYKAVMFACDLLKKGNSYIKSIGIACKYYNANPEDVKHYVSQRSGRKQANIKNKKYS